MIINVIPDASVSNAPAGFEPAVQAAVQFLENNFSAPITITLHVGYGEINGQTLDSGDLGESEENPSIYSYSQIKTALLAHASSAGDAVAKAAAATLPSTSPISGTFGVAAAEAEAIGLLPSTVPVSGWVGFGTGAPFDYDDSNGVSAGQFDFFGVAIHEITEVMGRDAGLDANASGTYTILDLFRYSASGVRNLVGTQTGYFSPDGGKTDLGDFNTDPGGDFGDWSSKAGNDSFLAFSSAGVINAVTANDLKVMDILGFDQVVLPVTVMSVLTSPASGNVAAGRAVTITLDVSGQATVTGAPTLTLNDGGTATYDSGRSSAQALVFDYTVGASDRTTNLAIVAVNEPAGTTVTDSTGKTADLSAAINGAGTGLQIGTIMNGTVTGGSGDDVFYALATSLAFSGGGGHDTVVFDGASSLYHISENSDGSVTVVDTVANHDGSHILTGIEDLRFTDKIVFVENTDNANLARLYAATFARAPDVGGLNYWEDAYATVATSAKTDPQVGLAETNPTGMTASIAVQFIASNEFQQDYGANPTDTAFLTQLYHNALGRAPDPDGLSYWLNQMATGEAAGNTAIKGIVLVGFAESTENIHRTAADWLFHVV